jgi:AMP phosphorylase
MKLAIRNLNFSSGDVNVIVLDDDDAFALGAKPGDRVLLSRVTKKKDALVKGITAVVDISIGEGIVKRGEAGFYTETYSKMEFTSTDKEVEITLSSKPLSFDAIKKKIKGKKLTTAETQALFYDCTHGNLLPIEIAAFITALQINGGDDDEVVDFTRAMGGSGEILDFGPEVYDKHSTGGVPGNKVTLLIVPICAAAGLFIPKTSTRAITSPSGTADSMECLAPVSFTKEKILDIFKKEKAAILWGGALDLAPADDALIRIEKPLNMDPFPLMIASIISKKMAMGVRKMVLDIPCGPGTKFPTSEDGRKFAIRFKDIAKRVGIDCVCLLTTAQQPIGHFVGPALEAREAMRVLKNFDTGPSSLVNKSCELAGILLEMAGKTPEGTGKDMALELMRTGKAYEAMKRMIKVQGGDPDIDPESIPVGEFVAEMKALKDGHITAVDNASINKIAKIAGAPAAKKAGIEIVHKIGFSVKKGDVIFRIFSDNEDRLAEAVKYYNQHPPQILGGMTIERV